ncbi:Uncharacterised protein [Mycobacterium tuberculosis]|nr:Uncharacterised protein [Mycobacterium tuberculosis]
MVAIVLLISSAWASMSFIRSRWYFMVSICPAFCMLI